MLKRQVSYAKSPDKITRAIASMNETNSRIPILKPLGLARVRPHVLAAPLHNSSIIVRQKPEINFCLKERLRTQHVPPSLFVFQLVRSQIVIDTLIWKPPWTWTSAVLTFKRPDAHCLKIIHYSLNIILWKLLNVLLFWKSAKNG